MNLLRQWGGRLFGGKATVSVEMLRKWHLAAAVILIIQATAVLLLSGGYSVPIYVSFVTRDTLQSALHHTTITGPAIRELAQVNLAYVAAAMLLITGVGYLLLATVWRARYEAWLRQGRQPLRWVMTALSSSLMLVLLALLAGMQQLDTLKLIVALSFIAGLGAIQLELQDRKGRPPLWAWIGVGMTLFAAVAPLLVILLSLVMTALLGDARVPGATWSLYGVATVGLLLLVADTHAYRFRYGKWADYAYSDWWASGILVLTQTVFAWQLFAAVLKP